MKKSFFPLLLACILGVFVGCTKEDPNDEKGLFGHLPEYKDYLNAVKKDPALANSIKVEIKAKTQVIPSNPMKAGETYPKAGETDLTKGTFELDIKSKLDEQGIPIDKLLSIKLLEATVQLDKARCDAVTIELKKFELPASIPKKIIPTSISCDEADINKQLEKLVGEDFAEPLKKGGKVSVQYSIKALKDLPTTQTGATINVRVEVILSTK